ncbi:MAG: GHKL domain-containing protein, partial [Saprospiraceae bacterium]|nr:GHKL domain-containing protein [Saprospiraceae bacterium]
YFWVLSDDKKLIRIKKDGSEPPTFLTDFQPELSEANQIFSDNKGNIWIPTQFGLYQLAPRKQNFKRLHFNASPNESHKNQTFRSIQSVDQGGEKILWAAGEKQGQIIKIDLETEKSRIISENFDFQWTVGKNQKNEIFFFENKGIQKINGLTGEYLKFYPFDETDDVWLVSFFHEDRYGKNWYNNLLDGSLRYFTENETKIFPLWAGIGDNFYIYQMEETTNDTAWLGTNVGLFKMSIKDGKIYERYWSGENASLPFDNVHHFHITGDHEFWLATAGNGLIKWSPEKGVISQVTRSDGLSNNTLYAVYPDKRGNLWLTSDFGINVYNVETGRIKIYTTKDGISHNEFNRISHHEDKDGNLYFGSLNGITAFHPASFSIDSSQHHPPVVLTEFSQYDKNAEKFVDRASEVRKTNTISIYPDDPMINLKFSLLSYEDMNNVLYAIKTEGVDEDWIYQKSNRYTLGRMPYGKHMLRIKGLASNGQWSKQELQIEINTIAPYYLRPWFPISILLTISAAFFFYYKRREKILKERSAKLEAIVLDRTATIERQKEDLKSLDAMKSRLFANVSHELRTPITLIKGPIKTVLGSKKLDEKNFQLLTMAQRNANSLLKLVNSILELSKMEHGNLVLNEKPEHIHPLIKRQVANFESLAHQKNIDLQLTLGTEPNLVIQIDKEKFEIVLNNLLSNALKFTNKNGQIELKVKQKLKTLLISVQDNGRGISENDLPFVFDRFYQSNEQDAPLEGGTGIGLAYCKELVNLMDGQIWVESKKGFGSTFSLEIPMKKVNH